MKKFIISIVILFTTLFALNINAFALDLPYNSNFKEEYQITESTYELEFNVKFDENTMELAYNIANLHHIKTDNTLKFLVISNVDTNVIIYNKADNKTIKILDLDFVNPESVEIAKSKDNNFYFVKANGKPLYGDFVWSIDGKEVIANQVSTDSDNVKLSFNGKDYLYNKEEVKSPLEQYIILILGLPIFIFIIGYVIYIMVPTNIYKKIYKMSVKIKKSINKPGLDYSKVLFKLKLKLPLLSNLISMIDETEPKIKAYNKVNSDLNKMLDNLINLEGFFPEENLEGILKYVNRKLDVYIIITENGNHKYKRKVEAIVTKPIISKPSMDRNQNDSFRYLESIKVINRDTKEEDK